MEAKKVGISGAVLHIKYIRSFQAGQVLNMLSSKIKALNRRKDSDDLLKLSCPEIDVLIHWLICKLMMLVVCSLVAKVSAGARISRRP